MEAIVTALAPLAKYGLMGFLLILSIVAIIYMYMQQKKTFKETAQELKDTRKEYQDFIKTNNDKLMIIIGKNSDAYENMTSAFNKNTIVNSKFADMIEDKIDLLELLRKSKEQ